MSPATLNTIRSRHVFPSVEYCESAGKWRGLICREAGGVAVKICGTDPIYKTKQTATAAAKRIIIRARHDNTPASNPVPVEEP